MVSSSSSSFVYLMLGCTRFLIQPNQTGNDLCVMFRYCTRYIVHHPYSTVSESLSNGMQNHEINSGPATVSDFESNFGAVQSRPWFNRVQYVHYGMYYRMYRAILYSLSYVCVRMCLNLWSLSLPLLSSASHKVTRIRLVSPVPNDWSRWLLISFDG